MQQESSLVARAQAGDRDAVNELVASCWSPVFRLVAYKIGNREDAKEITQETFIRAIRTLPTYQQQGHPFKTYLNHIALNLVTDFWRKKGRTPVTVDIAEYNQPVAAGDEPDAQVISSETRAEIAALLKELPAEQRQAVELRIIAGLPVRETALAMGKSDAAIKMLQQRALKNLRAMLLNRGIIEAGEGVSRCLIP